MDSKEFRIHFCLPFLSVDVPVYIGPILFCPCDRIAEFFDSDVTGKFLTHLEKLTITPQEAIFIAIHPDIPDSQIDELFLNGIHLLYFISIYEDLYQSLPIHSFRSFTKYIPVSETWVQSDKELRLITTFRKTKILLDEADLLLCHGFGEILNEIYLSEECKQDKKSFIRSIRFFVNTFLSQFENILNDGASLPKILFIPEEIVYINVAFEVLFDIDISHLSSNFKQILRPLFYLRYSRPVEMLWKWVDGFCNLFHSLTHSGETPDIIFRANKNYEVSYFHLGIMIYIYAIFYKLYTYKLITSSYEGPDSPPKFYCIDPDEILTFFWTEEGLLKKISIILMQLSKQPDVEEFRTDASSLIAVFNEKIKKFYKKSPPIGVKFIREENPRLKEYAHTILNIISETIVIDGKETQIKSILPENFENHLRDHFG